MLGVDVSVQGGGGGAESIALIAMSAETTFLCLASRQLDKAEREVIEDGGAHDGVRGREWCARSDSG